MRNDEIEDRKLMLDVGAFCVTTLHATHLARSFSANSSNLGKYTFVLSSHFVLTIPPICLVG